MALSFFVQESSWTTTALRSGWSFVIAYGLTFLLVNIIALTRRTEAERLGALDAAEAEAMLDAAREEAALAEAGEAEAGEATEDGAAAEPPIQ
jgi:hypothetical protein